MAVRFKKHTTDSFFGHFLYEQIIPKDHFLVRAKQTIDWDRFTQKCLRFYKGSGWRKTLPRIIWLLAGLK